VRAEVRAVRACPSSEQQQIFLSFYGHDISFCNIDLQEIKLGWDGPIARLVFCLNEFPASPPEKWKGINTVQVELALFPLYEVNLTTFWRGNKCDLDIEPFKSDVFNMTRASQQHRSKR
jgi:hypothetical protein